MKTFLILVTLSLSAFAQNDPFTSANNHQTLDKQISDLKGMRTRKNQLTQAEFAQEQRVRQAIGQKQRQADDLERGALKAQFLKEHPECSTKCLPDKRTK